VGAGAAEVYNLLFQVYFIHKKPVGLDMALTFAFLVSVEFMGVTPSASELSQAMNSSADFAVV
jgi:hypothetical protein